MKRYAGRVCMRPAGHKGNHAIRPSVGDLRRLIRVTTAKEVAH